MNLITIGNWTVNMDYVAEIRDHGDQMYIYFIEKSATKVADVALRGAEADALRMWLKANSRNLCREYKQSGSTVLSN